MLSCPSHSSEVMDPNYISEVHTGLIETLEKWRIPKPNAGLPNLGSKSERCPPIVERRNPDLFKGQMIVVICANQTSVQPVFVAKVLKVFKNRDGTWMRVRWFRGKDGVSLGKYLPKDPTTNNC